MDWTDLKLLVSTVAGAVLALFLASEHSLKERTFILGAGVFAAFFFTEPIVTWAGEPFLVSGWPYAIAGVLSLSGSRLARRLWHLIDELRFPWFGDPRQ